MEETTSIPTTSVVSGDEIVEPIESVDNSKEGAKKRKKQVSEEERKKFWAHKKQQAKERKKAKGEERRAEAAKRPKREKVPIKSDEEEEEKVKLLRKERKELWLNKPTEGSIIFDLDFDSLMLDKEIRSLSSQLVFCYASNKKLETPVHMAFTSFNGRLADQLKLHNGFSHWKIDMHPEHFSKVYPLEKTVYLTAESDTVLQDIESDKHYVIGGIVDKNRHKTKGLTANKAKELGMNTARLPLEQYMDMSTRKVLTVNQVMEIICHYLSTKSWSKAMDVSIPMRKGAHVKEGEEKSEKKEGEEKKEEETENTESKEGTQVAAGKE
ncbi:RNA (guanine-9-)-methyltransferase domain-containing protein [Planoprotostelium fungivorum]|uniref:tRNA (guanine(9)-N(1))-methyltransferase n=1 Tax=Planoprotostelium fungivorum TaxID=1890364 RepID=A0A2P6N2P2_9EUKA|nr:RNA (guanine-9-)-methyltransferase domain-containing protein [Planoprotostelium fungivorum]